MMNQGTGLYRRLQLVSTAISTASPSFLRASRRFALCVGCDKYREAPVNDAKAIGKTLKSLSFETTVLTNPTKVELMGALASIERKQNDLGVFFWAGQGSEMLQENFLHLPSPSAPDSLLKLSIVLDLFGGSGIDPGNSTSLFVFDTCRVRHVGGRAIAEQIAYRLPRIPQPTQSAFLFAAKPRQVSREDNGHGDFTRSLLRFVTAPDELYDVYKVSSVAPHPHLISFLHAQKTSRALASIAGQQCVFHSLLRSSVYLSPAGEVIAAPLNCTDP